MSSPYYNVTTNAGDAAIANSIATNTKLNITHIAFGDGNGSSPTPDKTRTNLVKEVYRQGVNKYEKHPTINNFVVVEAILPPIVGSFYIREIGLIIDGSTLISHGAVAPVFKEANSVREYRLKFTINIQDAEIVNVMLDDTLIYATQAWVDDNYVPRDEIINNLTTNDATKPLSAAQGKKLQDEKLPIAGGTVTGNLTVAGSMNARDIQNTTGNNLSFLNGGTALGINVGKLLVSNSYSDATKVPVDGGYIKGQLVVDGGITGNASSATKLATARTIGGVLFDGTANINLPGVNAAGNQSTTGNAGSATKLQTARTISLSGGATGTATSFDGTANISIPITTLDATKLTGVASVDTTGSAASLTTARTINGVAFDGSANINIHPFVMQIANNTDLNTLTYAGFFKCTTDAGAQTLLNSPTTHAFSLLVEVAAGSIQTLTEYMPTGAVTFRRHFYNTGWGAWYQIYTSVNPQPSVAGNAGTATKLQNARTINGVAFDGSSDITIADNTKVPLAGGTMTGSLSAPSLGVKNTDGTTAKGVSLYGGATDGKPNYGLYFSTTAAFGTHGAVVGQWATYFNIITANDVRGWIFQTADTNVASISTSGVITANSFVGGLSGNAATASKLETARSITFTGDATGAYSFDGSANISCTLTIRLATTTQKGIVQLNNTLTSTATDQALTAAMGKQLQDQKAALAGATFTGQIIAPNVQVGNGSYPSFQLRPNGNDNGAIFEMAPTGYPYFAIRPTATLGSSTGQVASFGFPSNKTGGHTIATVSDIPAIVDNLTTNDATKPLSAAQGKLLQDQKAPIASPIFTGGLTVPRAYIDSIELGNPANTVQPYMDFHSSGNASVDYDARIIGAGGTTTAGQGILQYIAAKHTFTGPVETPQGITGNASSATKLQNVRTINGVAFDGSANINVNPYVNYITTGQDMNSFIDAGFYQCVQNAIAGSLLNTPTSTAFALLVEEGAGVIQTVTEYLTSGSPKSFRRHMYSGTWGEWYQLYTSVNPQQSVTGNAGTATKLASARTINGVAFDGSANITVADSTKLPLAGGTVTGNLTVTGSMNAKDIQNTTGNNLSFLNGGTALGINVGKLLVSNSYSDATKVPVDGGYVKGQLVVDGGISGNASSATKLETARTISASGDATWSVSFDGSANATAALTLASTGVAAGTYGNNITVPGITVDVKGRVTGVTSNTIRSATTAQTGVVQLQDTLTSTSTTLALTAAQGKVLNDKVNLKAAIADFATVQGTSGYQKLPNGTIIQWVRLEKGVASFSGDYNFPITFPNACFGVSVSNSWYTNSAGNGYQLRAGVKSTSVFGIGEDNFNSQGAGNIAQALVIAIGN